MRIEVGRMEVDVCPSSVGFEVLRQGLRFFPRLKHARSTQWEIAVRSIEYDDSLADGEHEPDPTIVCSAKGGWAGHC